MPPNKAARFCGFETIDFDDEAIVDDVLTVGAAALGSYGLKNHGSTFSRGGI